MKAILPVYFLCGFMDGFSGVIRGAGFAIYPTIVNVIGVCGLRLIWIFTIFQIPEFHTISVLFLSWPLSWIFVIIALGIFYFVYARKEITKLCNASTIRESEKVA
jgi:Na+-driven multidrug efflux pump